MDYQIQELIELIDSLADSYHALLKRVIIKDSKLVINKFKFEIGSKPLVISVGKCAFKMAKWAKEIIKPERGIIVRPSNDPLDKIEGFIEVRSTHPLPSEKSIEASKIIEEEIKKDYSSVIFLISGGSSSLIEDPLVDLEDLIKLNDLLLKSGATIFEINAVRKHLSKIKGGRLAKICKPRMITLAISDVPFDDISTIGSAPTVADPTTYKDAYAILKNRGIWDKIPESIRNIINKGMNNEIEETPKHLNSPHFIVLRNRDVLEGIKEKMRNLHPLILTSWASGESKEIAKLFARIFLEDKNKKLLIMGGEPEVKVIGKGKGGRNTEFVLSFIINAVKENFKILAYATDGFDGNSNAAGAWADENTLKEIIDAGIDIEKEFSDNNTAFAFEKVNKLIKRGYTGNNVSNVYLAMKC